MKLSSLHVAFLWHMHQPCYKHPETGLYMLPWVRLHAVKGYYDMARLHEELPGFRSTFNFSGSLLKQLSEYASGKIKETFLDLSLKPASELSKKEKQEILWNFFSLNWETMSDPFPGYRDLLQIRKQIKSPQDALTYAENVSTRDILDLQVWFNLAWMGHYAVKDYPYLNELRKKGRSFTEKDKTDIIKTQFEIIAKVIPLYKKLQDRKQIEISVSPFNHPILPLLIDTEYAVKSEPATVLPNNNFRYPEDALNQITKAVDEYTLHFGRKPLGLWPSEGSVCDEIIPMLSRNGFIWTATDEEILNKTLKEGYEKKSLYRPYKLEAGESEINIIFRDHALSDKIGFVYSRMDPDKASDDLVANISSISDTLAGSKTPGLVSIILDGENPWEYYRQGGIDFLNKLFSKLGKAERLKSTTVSDFILGAGPRAVLKNIFPGSWISHNFRIWIGDRYKNQAWDILAEARRVIEQNMPKNRDAALKNTVLEKLYTAEASDWFWWYGDINTSEFDDIFDGLFRANIISIYKTLGHPIPGHIYTPITETSDRNPEIKIPSDYIRPVIDGEITDFYEWRSAAYYQSLERSGASMHRATSMFTGFYYGFDTENLFFRIDPAEDMAGRKRLFEDIKLIFSFSHFQKESAALTLSFEPLELTVKNASTDKKFSLKNNIAFGKIIEFAVPLKYIERKNTKLLDLRVSIFEKGTLTDQVPSSGHLQVMLPGVEFESRIWSA
ncbi:MAG: glycoside hydrolase [Candidatus Aureabacteria bacterium]|nr:glycoside hydrolase [Candidatus Auribacterota bacterium]